MRRAFLLLPFALLASLPVPGQAEEGEGDYGLREADPADPLFDTAAFRHYAATFGNVCYWGDTPEPARAWAPQRWALEWPNDHGDRPHRATLYRFYCDSGAYNVRFVWYLETEPDAAAPLSFARPVFDVANAGERADDAVEAITLRGYAADQTLTNAQFDPETGVISGRDHWRGLGDASSYGEWIFREGAFVLTRYEIDASYDGEIAPQRVLTFE